MRTNEVLSGTARLCSDGEGFVRITLLPGAVQTLADAQEETKTLSAITGNRSCVMLVDIRSMKSQTRDAREHLIKEGTKTARAIAILVGSPTSRVIGNFVTMFHRTPVPIKLFTVEAEAIVWLKEFLA